MRQYSAPKPTVFTTWCFTERGYDTVRRPSVRPSVCGVQVCFANWLEYVENNFTADYIKVLARLPGPTGSHVRLAWNKGGVQKTCNISETVQDRNKATMTV